MEKDPSGVVTTAGTDADSSGFGGGLTYLGTLLSTGPFALKSGIGGEFVRWGAPKNYSGSWSYSVFSFEWPLVFDVSVADHWSLRITQNIAAFTYAAESAGTYSYTYSSTAFNSFAPTIGGYYTF
jgi:hypothetical protein